MSIFTIIIIHIGVLTGDLFWYYENINFSTEGTLYIEIIDAKKKELIWQGKGSRYIPKDIDAKERAINELVNKILEKYPPTKK